MSVVTSMLLMFGVVFGVGAEDIESARARLELCSDQLNRTEYELDRTEQTIEDLRDIDIATGSPENLAGTLESLSSRHDLLKRRLTRARTQYARIKDRLGDLSGSCPDCISSDVDLFCRQAENVYSESGELLDRIRETTGTAKSRAAATKALNRAQHALEEARMLAAVAEETANADSGHAALAEAHKACENAAQTLANDELQRTTDWAFRCAKNAEQAAKLLSASGMSEEAGWARLNALSQELSRQVAGSADPKTAKIFELANHHLTEARTLINQKRAEEAVAELRIAESLLEKIQDRVGR